LVHPLIIAHRGFSSERPENTISSFDHAFNNGFNLLELDVHLSSDGVLVVMHDEKVDRTTNGTGFLKSMTYKEISQLDAGSWFRGTDEVSYTGQVVPSLDQFLSRYSSKVHVFIEIKSLEEELIDKLKERLSAYGLIPKISSERLDIPGTSIISFNRAQITLSARAMPTVGHGLLVIKPTEDHIRFCVDNQIRGLFPNINFLSSELMDLAKSNSLHIGVWGADSVEDLALVSNYEVLGVTVDWPSEAKKYFQGDI
jgi:glycerophosphoryl diester phosphodiesterase|tara:strand:- start:12419 stop:13183 length:765 start_codon:yes stop_codon:yes gene_type:complete